MNLEQLKAALKAGTITLEQFKAQAKAWLAAQLTSQAMDQAAHDTALADVEATTEGGGAGGGGGGGLTDEQVKAMIAAAVQSATDKIRTEYSGKSKKTEEELERLKREKMTAEELAADNLKRAQEDIATREAELLKREVDLHTVDVLTKSEIPLDFRSFLAADSKENTDTRITTFKATWDKALKDAVEKRFKDGGTDPNQGKGGGGGDVNPFKQGEGFNLTKQAEMLRTNPTLAAQLMAAAK